MDIKLKNEIKRLEYNLELYHASYMQELDEIEEKTQRIDVQIERCTSEVKREVLRKQKEYYEKQISRLDNNMENNTRTINEKIGNFKRKLEELEKEKRSLEYNIDKLKVALERRNTSEIFDMFEYVTNAITILHEESSSRAHEHV
jgi:predicted  nucleic acid-binding Zn-ribbon protein